MSSAPGTPYRVEFTRRANLDLDAIFLYIDAENSIAAQQWLNGLIAAIESLAKEPQRSPRTAEDPTLYHLLYGNEPHIYRIIYDLDSANHEVTIVFAELHRQYGIRG